MGDERLWNLSLLHNHRTRNLSVEDLSTNLQWEKTDVWTLSNYQSVLLDMMTACAYMNSETLFFECFRECFFHTFCIYDNLRYRFNALWCWICVTVKIILKSDVETFSQKFSYSAKIYWQLRFLYCFHDEIRIYFMSFIVQISPFVHLFTLKIVSRWGLCPLYPPPGHCPGPDGGLKRPQTPRRKLCLHFILHIATPLGGGGGGGGGITKINH